MRACGHVVWTDIVVVVFTPGFMGWYTGQITRPKPLADGIKVLWPLTLKFDRATGLFLKFDMRYEAYRHEKKYYRHDKAVP